MNEKAIADKETYTANAVEVLGGLIQGKRVKFDPRAITPFIDLINELQECEHGRRRALLVSEAPEIARLVNRWLENPQLFRILSRRRSHEDYIGVEPEPVDWVIDEVLESDGLMMLYGDSGIGKTLVTMHMAACIGSGGDWFDRETSKRRVLYLEAENGEGIMHRRTHMIGYDTADIEYISFPHINLDDEGLDLLRLLVKETEAKVVVLDPLMNFMQGDENTVEAVRPQIKGLRELAEREGFAVILVHHENRGGGYRGSSAFKDLVTLLVRMFPDENKDGEDIHYVWLKPNKQRQSTMHTFPFIWFVDEDGKFRVGLLKEGEANIKDVEDLTEACWELESQDGKWPAKTSLRDARNLHGLSRSDAERALEQAIDRGVLKVKVEANNRHTVYVP